jgi:glycosyltransferase involved in cell wall biosynthesis
MKRRNSPRVSILIPVYNTEPEILEQCIESVVSQHYKNWQLCIVDDGSTESNVLDVLRRWKKLDRRIRIKFSKKNQGIAATINLCAKMARGKYIGVLDHDDLLEPSAISDYIQLIRRSPKADVIYCDEDKIDLDGQFIEPWHKSDWNPDLALCFNYVMHFVVVRRKLFKRIGGVRTDYEGSQDYDFLLRVTELTDNIHHIPKILYHWRLGQDSIAGGPGPKPEVFVNGLAALSAALERRGIEGQAVDAPDAWKGVYRVIRNIDDQIKCSIIVILIGESLEATERLVYSINN